MHDGETIELIIRRDQISISELSRRLRVSRKSIYNWFKQERLNIDIIDRIGQSIGYSIAGDFPDRYHSDQENSEAGESLSGRPSEQASESPQYWRDKYIRLLEAYTDFLSQHQPQLNNEH
ncbi:hypothetical protein C7T94_11660 [Pedobacter yulinensis]|uniref:Uncharacterized protein n=1 Tax=Pedobacter yulinensis TaxID=2126353 RepID=A0A2T3HLC2_9SPHI|nr:helix-turn-helix domain-containing protein [Pedobacter yulinensis]PST83242.1 hypothetical protein C7T94_11660 [Pedobacter yulinensis]